MDYYDGNTVTGLWNYAQHFAMSDNSFGTTYGPSTPGALNVTTGNTYPTLCAADAGTTAPGGDDPDVYDAAGSVKPCPGGLSTLAPPTISIGNGTGTMVSDADPYYDACANKAGSAAQGGQNIGDLLNKRHVSWGWFEGGFSSPNYVPGRPSTFDPTTICKGLHYNIGAGAALAGQPCTTSSPAAADRRLLHAGLQPASRAVPVLRVHQQSQASAAELGQQDRRLRSSQSPVRSGRFLGMRSTMARCPRCRI